MGYLMQPKVARGVTEPLRYKLWATWDQGGTFPADVLGFWPKCHAVQCAALAIIVSTAGVLLVPAKLG